MFALVKRFAGMICSMWLNVLHWSAVQRSVQCIANMVLHRSHRTAFSTDTTQVESAMTKITNLSHNRCGFGASSAGFGRVLMPLGLG